MGRSSKSSKRVISNAGFLDCIQPLFIIESIINIYKLYEYMCCIYVFKNRNRYEVVSNIYNTRNTSSTLCKKSIYLKAPSIFNSHPPEFSSLQTFNKFKNELKRYLIHSCRQTCSIVGQCCAVGRLSNVLSLNFRSSM